jgi:hypothetical protein
VTPTKCFGGQKYLGTSVGADCDTPQILGSAEHDLDPVTPFVVTFVVFDSLLASPSTFDHRPSKQARMPI